MTQHSSANAFIARSAIRSALPSPVSVTGDVRVIEHTYSPGGQQDKHAHPYASISVVIAGSVTETVGAKTEDAFALSVVVKPTGTEHANRFGTAGARVFSVRIEQVLVDLLHDYDLRLRNWRWVHGGPATRWMLRLLQASQRATLRNTDLEDLTYEILASLPNKESPDARTGPPPWLQRVREELDEIFCDGVHVRDLAARAKVHPVYLARMFRRYIGCSITDYKTLLKTRAAAQLLSSSDVSLATAAHDCGFADQSHMGRAFKTVSGLTPRNYRRLINRPER